jgi:hypothetical protein
MSANMPNTQDGVYDGANATSRRGSMWYPGSHVFIADRYKRETIVHLRFVDQVPVLSMIKKINKFFVDLGCGYLTNPQSSKSSMNKEEIVSMATMLRKHYQFQRNEKNGYATIPL